MEIREASANDVESVQALLLECRLPIDGVPDELESLFVAAVDGRIVGVAGIELHEGDGLMRSIAVSPALRGRNVASRLCAEVERRAESLRAQRLFLLTETAESFFLKRGYRPLGRAFAPPGIASSREFSTVCPASAVLTTLRVVRVVPRSTVERLEQLAREANDEDRVLFEEFTAHDRAQCDFAERELAGDGLRSIEPVLALLDRVEQGGPSPDRAV